MRVVELFTSVIFLLAFHHIHDVTSRECRPGEVIEVKANCTEYLLCDSGGMWQQLSCDKDLVFQPIEKKCVPDPDDKLCDSASVQTGSHVFVVPLHPVHGQPSTRHVIVVSTQVSERVSITVWAVSFSSVHRTPQMLDEAKGNISRYIRPSLTFEVSLAYVTKSHLDVAFVRASSAVQVLYIKALNGVPITSMATVLPSHSASNCYQVTLDPSYPVGRTRQFSSYFVVVATDNVTEASITFPQGRQPPVSLRVENFTFTEPRQMDISLDTFQPKMTTTSADLTGTVISANRPVLVFAGMEDAVQSTDSSDLQYTGADVQVLPLSLQSDTYITVPSPDALDDGFLVAARADNTYVEVEKIAARTSGRGGRVHLQSAGDLAVFSLPTDGFYKVKANRPVTMSKIGNQKLTGSNLDHHPTCIMNLIGQNLWASTYQWSVPNSFSTSDVTLYLHVVMLGTQVSQLLIDDVAATGLRWRGVLEEDSNPQFSATTVQVKFGHHTVSSVNHAAKFAAYIHGSGSKSRFCTSLTSHLPQPPTSPASGLCSPAFGNFDIKYGFDRAEEVKPKITYLKSLDPNIEASNASDLLVPVSPPIVTHEVRCVNVTITEVVVVTEEMKEAVAMETKAKLYVNPKLTSCSRRRLHSAPDTRTSSRNLGICGVACCVLALLAFVFLDAIHYLAWKQSKRKALQQQQQQQQSGYNRYNRRSNRCSDLHHHNKHQEINEVDQQPKISTNKSDGSGCQRVKTKLQKRQLQQQHADGGGHHQCNNSKNGLMRHAKF